MSYVKTVKYHTLNVKRPHCGPEVLFETCVAVKFVDDNDDYYYWEL